MKQAPDQKQYWVHSSIEHFLQVKESISHFLFMHPRFLPVSQLPSLGIWGKDVRKNEDRGIEGKVICTLKRCLSDQDALRGSKGMLLKVG